MSKYETPWSTISGILLADKSIYKNLELAYVLFTIWTHEHTCLCFNLLSSALLKCAHSEIQDSKHS